MEMKCFWSSVAIMVAIFLTPAHCQQRYHNGSENQVLIREMSDNGVNQHSCSLELSLLNVSYIGPERVVVSWSEEDFVVLSTQTVTLTLYEYDADSGEATELNDIHKVMETCYILTGLEQDKYYVVELCTMNMSSNIDIVTVCCCAIICAPTVENKNGNDSLMNNLEDTTSLVTCASVDPPPTALDIPSCSVKLPSLTPDRFASSFSVTFPSLVSERFPSSFITASSNNIPELTATLASISNPVMPVSSTTHQTTSAVIGSTDVFQPIPTSAPPTRTGTLASATIIGLALGGFVAVAAFFVTILVIGICWRQRKNYSSHKNGANSNLTAGAGMYETPVNIIAGANVIENPTVYATADSVHYIKQTNTVQTNASKTETASPLQEYEQNFSNKSVIVEPQMYETALSINSHNQPRDGAQMYEEPKDSILKYQQSQEVHEVAQQPYEVPLRTHSHDHQGKMQPQDQAVKPYASFPSSASLGRNNEKPPNYNSLNPGTLSEPQTYATVSSAPSPGFYSTPSEYAEPVASTLQSTPPNSHQYFVLDRGQSAEQQPAGREPLYFELENGNPWKRPTNQEAVENEYVDLERKVANIDERVHFELEQNGSDMTVQGPTEVSHPGTEEHPYFILERK